MENVLVTLSKNSLSFSNYQRPVHEKKLYDTNVISNDELVFSVKYLEKNKKLVSLFLSDLVKGHKINTLSINTYEIAECIMEIINMVPELTEVYFVEESHLPYTLCEKLIENNNLVHINCYSIPPYMLEMLDRSNLYVETRNEVLFTSKFMAVNNLSQYTKIYYKTSVRIEEMFDNNDEDDFESFCKVNRYLKNIHLYFVDFEFLELLVQRVSALRLKNIKIMIHKNIAEKEVVDKLKALNIEYKNKYNILLKIVYSETYLKDNIFAQVVVNFLKTMSLVVITIAAALFATIMFNNHLTFKKVEGINNDIAEILDGIEDEYDVPTGEQLISKKFLALLEINDDTVGWLKVKGTDVDYPVVQYSDNDFYLTRDYYKNNDYAGWVFMDYRNTSDTLGRNTIVYGHNRYYSKVIFGSLSNALNKSWYTNKDNLVITFDTLYETIEWEVFSVYRVDKTSDYIKTAFKTDDEYNDFLKLIKGRSIHNFDVKLTTDDKVLTLSTCLENNRRLVIHARQIVKEKEPNGSDTTNPTETVDENKETAN